MSNIIKAVKRSMAAEYARELSNKVFAGQCRLIELGFRQGGMAGYGLRRMRIDQNREPQGSPQARPVQEPADRPGDPRSRTGRGGGDRSVGCNRQFIEGGKLEGEIATLLNEKGIMTDLGRPWTRGTVHQVLTNEKYVGNNVYNRHSYKLKDRHRNNPPDEWVRANGVFDAVVDAPLFFTAQGMIRERNRRFSDGDMIDCLRELLKKEGFLSGIVIDEADNMPSSGAYASRFGSLVRAYSLVGFTPERDYSYIEINRALRRIHADAVTDAIAEIEKIGAAVSRDPATDLLTVNGEFTASIVVARCRHTKAGARRWNIRLDTGLAPDLTVALRMDGANEAVLDYYLLPLPILDTNRIRLAEANGLMLDAFRFETLNYFFAMAERTPISEIAA